MTIPKSRILKKVTKKVEDELEAEEYVTIQQQKKINDKKQQSDNPVCDIVAPETILDLETGETITFDKLNREYLPPQSIKLVPINDEQFDCCKKILAWLHTKQQDRQPFWRLGGLAGTGKTTIISYIINECQQLFPSAIRYKEIAVLTYAWKAALVLRSKGVPAASIHSLFYQLDGVGADGTPLFSKRNPEEVRDSYGLIVIDEASMTDRDLRHDIESYGIPVFYVGDHGQ